MQTPDTDHGFSHPDYKEFGAQHTEEERREAGFAAIALLFGADWSLPEVGYYLRPAYERLSEFAGDDGFNEAADEVYLMSLPDKVLPDLVDEGLSALKRAFDWTQAPHAKRYWQEVSRAARKSVKGAVS